MMPLDATPRTAMATTGLRWLPERRQPVFAGTAIAAAVRAVSDPLYLVLGPAGRVGVGLEGRLVDAAANGEDGYPVLGVLPVLAPNRLGDPEFCRAHGVDLPYVAGAMANGIATTELVTALARARMVGFFGAAGLEPERVERAVVTLARDLGSAPNWGVNLIFTPETGAADRVADILLRHRVPRICASAFVLLSPSVVRCAATGLRTDRAGRIVRPVGMFAKVSRPEVARQFLSPAPEAMLRALVARGRLSESEARLAARVPVATDVTVEADSGGHTDNRPLSVVLPAIRALAEELTGKFGYAEPPRVGAGGGLGCPAGVAAAFAAGAAYVLTGSVNQLALEAGVSDEAKAMLAAADLADVTMAPAADMFEAGIRVQVLRRGTMFAARATRLYETWRAYPSLEAIGRDGQARLEREVLHANLTDVWAATQAFWAVRDPAQLAAAETDPKHKMALLFRWYLGMSSRWAIEGDPGRRTDYQLWAGPAIGAFNRWTAGTFLADPRRRSVVQIARNLMAGAAVLTRAHQLRTLGVEIPAAAFTYTPVPLA